MATLGSAVRTRTSQTLGRAVAIGLIVLWSLLPLYWTLNTSFMSTARAESKSLQFLPIPIDPSNYAQILGLQSSQTLGTGSGAQFFKALMNSIIESSLATAITVVLATLGGYAFARMRFRLRSTLLYIVLATMALPVYAVLIPLYRLLSDVKLVNSYLAIVLVDVAAFLPLTLWVVYSYIETIPREMEEAAAIDGASAMRTLWRIMVPLAMPGIISACIIVFLLAWDNFVFPLVLSISGATQPLTVWITSLQGEHLIPYTLLNAAGFIAILVPIVLVATLSKRIVAGLLAGSNR